MLPSFIERKIRIDLPDTLQAPVAAGQLLGEARLTCGGEVIGVSPLVAAQSVPRDDLPARIRRCIEEWLLLSPAS